jgi:Ca-activated chloride channel family protein
MKTLTLQTHFDNRFYLKGSNKQELYLYLDLKACRFESQQKRLPLNLAVILDRSGSMQGDKLAYAKKATEFIIQNLNADDVLSIIQYDSQVDVLSPSQKVENKAELIRKVQAIQDRGSTNFSGGLLEGYHQVGQSKQNGYVNRCLMLSDGEANVGITQPQELQRIASTHFREKGIGLSTFGLGEGFNELLMTGLAEHGGGNYYFIASPDAIPSIFSQELQGLLCVVAQNTKLRLRFPSQFLRFNRAFGYLAHAQGDSVEIALNDVFSEEQKAILLKFDLLQAPSQDLELDLELSYDDAVEALGRVQEKHYPKLLLTEKAQDLEQGQSLEALESIASFVAGDWFEQIMALAEQRKMDQAMDLGKRCVEYLEAHLRLLPQSKLLSDLLRQVKTYVEGIPSMKDLSQAEMSMQQKSYRSDNYKMSKRKF